MHATVQPDSSFCCFISPQIKHTCKHSCFPSEEKSCSDGSRQLNGTGKNWVGLAEKSVMFSEMLTLHSSWSASIHDYITTSKRSFIRRHQRHLASLGLGNLVWKAFRCEKTAHRSAVASICSSASAQQFWSEASGGWHQSAICAKDVKSEAWMTPVHSHARMHFWFRACCPPKAETYWESAGSCGPPRRHQTGPPSPGGSQSWSATPRSESETEKIKYSLLQ